MTYVSLHTHSEFSRLDGASKLDALAQRAAEIGMPALGLTDHGNLYGAMKHWKACRAAGIKPIIGVEFYVAPEDLTTKAPIRWGAGAQRPDDVSRGAYNHLTVLAKDVQGLRNLYKLHEISYLSGYYYHPRIDRAVLAQYSAGLIVLSGCVSGELATRIRLEQLKKATETAEWFAETFPGRYYIELMDHGIEIEDRVRPHLLELAKSLDLPLVATLDTHYTIIEEKDVQDALGCLQTNSQLADKKRFRLSGEGYHLEDPVVVARRFDFVPGAVETTLKIAEEVESYDDLFRTRNLLPVMPQGIARGKTVESLQERAEKGLLDRLGAAMDLDPTSHYWERLDYEIKTIEALGFSGYFTVLADVVSWARLNGILVGPARGSAGGSLVAFALGITDIDPVYHGLIFERFLNPSRQGYPDIDVDFQASRRDEVYQYASERFGPDRVANLITFGVIKSKYAIKDAARVLGRDVSVATRLSGMIPPLKRGRQDVLAECPAIGKADPEVYALALGLEGQVRQTGVHAGGLVISPLPLSDVIPTKKDVHDNLLMTGFEQEELDELGLVKYDLLALNNLDVVAHTLELINNGTTT